MYFLVAILLGGLVSGQPIDEQDWTECSVSCGVGSQRFLADNSVTRVCAPGSCPRLAAVDTNRGQARADPQNVILPNLLTCNTTTQQLQPGIYSVKTHSFGYHCVSYHPSWERLPMLEYCNEYAPLAASLPAISFGRIRPSDPELIFVWLDRHCEYIWFSATGTCENGRQTEQIHIVTPGDNCPPSDLQREIACCQEVAADCSEVCGGGTHEVTNYRHVCGQNVTDSCNTFPCLALAPSTTRVPSGSIPSGSPIFAVVPTTIQGEVMAGVSPYEYRVLQADFGVEVQDGLVTVTDSVDPQPGDTVLLEVTDTKEQVSTVSYIVSEDDPTSTFVGLVSIPVDRPDTDTDTACDILLHHMEAADIDTGTVDCHRDSEEIIPGRHLPSQLDRHDTTNADSFWNLWSVTFSVSDQFLGWQLSTPTVDTYFYAYILTTKADIGGTVESIYPNIPDTQDAQPSADQPLGSCGSTLLQRLFISDTWGGVFIGHCCDRHDFDYGDCYMEKCDADAPLWDCVWNTCFSFWSNINQDKNIATCAAFSTNAHAIVKQRGDPVYASARQGCLDDNPSAVASGDPHFGVFGTSSRFSYQGLGVHTYCLPKSPGVDNWLVQALFIGGGFTVTEGVAVRFQDDEGQVVHVSFIPALSVRLVIVGGVERTSDGVTSDITYSTSSQQYTVALSTTGLALNTPSFSLLYQRLTLTMKLHTDVDTDGLCGSQFSSELPRGEDWLLTDEADWLFSENSVTDTLDTFLAKPTTVVLPQTAVQRCAGKTHVEECIFDASNSDVDTALATYQPAGCRECGIHGRCASYYPGSCVCDDGYVGHDCEFLCACTNSNGVCLIDGTCLCNPGYASPTCEEKEQCDECTNGFCQSGCRCFPGWTGDRCEECDGVHCEPTDTDGCALLGEFGNGGNDNPDGDGDDEPSSGNSQPGSDGDGAPDGDNDAEEEPPKRRVRLTVNFNNYHCRRP